MHCCFQVFSSNGFRVIVLTHLTHFGLHFAYGTSCSTCTLSEGVSLLSISLGGTALGLLLSPQALQSVMQKESWVNVQAPVFSSELEMVLAQVSWSKF